MCQSVGIPGVSISRVGWDGVSLWESHVYPLVQWDGTDCGTVGQSVGIPCLYPLVQWDGQVG